MTDDEIVIQIQQAKALVEQAHRADQLSLLPSITPRQKADAEAERNRIYDNAELVLQPLKATVSQMAPAVRQMFTLALGELNDLRRDIDARPAGKTFR